ncbi:PREDICTED: tumor necrosis factor alpha-induced protein 8-like protein 1 isoform X2 [Priapulus caudatus]|uniref:Tumor necrosis factor alpha-induced protein 8-like protein 1 isoform X2 n=1 Tax=Priapulus caudatus TaxID=37621 RepID=A0ABM1E7E8_PRICU|nr:PREDICTED: tumor necrosis factor alpha-induced protein 8-like protein 1 isoform X2 [Priapulus caudatus]
MKVVCVDTCHYCNMAESNFKAKDMGMRVQKKIFGKMATKGIAKVFIDDTAGKALDCLYRMGKEYSGNKKDAERHMKYLIKTVVKVGVLYRNEQLNDDEHRAADAFRTKFRTACMTAISFHDVDYSFDRQHLARLLADCGALMQAIVRHHLTAKSLERAALVFRYFGGEDFLESAYRKENRAQLSVLIACLNKMMDDGVL